MRGYIWSEISSAMQLKSPVKKAKSFSTDAEDGRNENECSWINIKMICYKFSVGVKKIYNKSRQRIGLEASEFLLSRATPFDPAST